MKYTIQALVGLTVAGLTAGATAQFAPFNGLYTQDFNGLAVWSESDIFPLSVSIPGKGPHPIEGVLGATGMEGWYGGNPDGGGAAGDNTEFKAHNGDFGSSTGRGIVSLGASGSSDRALGFVPTSQQRNWVGVVLENTSDVTYGAITVAYRGEQWRSGDPDIFNVIEFTYGFGDSLDDAETLVSELTFHAPFLDGINFGIDGNDPANQEELEATITGLSWAPGETLVLRWKTNELPGQDNGLAIDDLIVTGIEGGPACPADLNGDGSVDSADLLALLNAWGFCPGCPEDLNGDGTVDSADLLELLSAWGDC